MADIFFFTNPDLLSQNLDQAFGPVYQNELEFYRTSSMHSANVDPQAIAICNGLICVQENDYGNLTLILKPTEQVSKITGVNFVPIKYFVYRGIKKESLIQTFLTPDDGVADLSKNDLTKIAWETQADLNIKTGSADDPASGLLGLNRSLTSGESIDGLFYQNSGQSFPSLIVNGGWHIGDFDKIEFGIEIILDFARTKIVSPYETNLNNVISKPSLVSNPTQREVYLWKNSREQVLDYLDPCAFYGSMVGSKVRYRNSTTPIGEFETDSEGQNIYLDLLSTFINKNKVYIDIRNEFNHSFNYYNNYDVDYNSGVPNPANLGTGDVIKILFGDRRDFSDSISTINYYSTELFSTWPILIVPKEISIGDPLYKQTNINRNRLELKISVPGDNLENREPTWYVSQGYKRIKHRGINKGPKELKDNQKFQQERVRSNNYTSAFKIMIPNKEDMGEATPISCYVRLKLFKKRLADMSEPIGSTKIVCRQVYSLDNLFLPFLMKSPSLIDATTQVRVFNEEYFINGKRLHNFVANAGIAIDSENVTLFAYSTDRMTGSSDSKINLSSLSIDKPHFINYLNEKFPVPKLVKEILNIGSTSPSYVRFVDTRSSRVAAVTADSPNLSEEFYAIILKQSTYNSIVAGNTLTQDFDINLILTNEVSDTDDDGIPYVKFDLVLKGYIDNGTDITHAQYDPGVKVYAYNNRGHFLILKEGDANVDLFTPSDTYKDCGSSNFSQKELVRLKSFIDFLQPDPPIIPINLYPPCKRYIDHIFTSEATTTDRFSVSLLGGSYVLNYPVNFPSNYQGYLAEAITTFIMWNFVQDLQLMLDADGNIPPNLTSSNLVSLSSSPGLNSYLVPEIYKRIYDVLILNGFIEPDTISERNEFNKMLQHSIGFGKGLPKNAVENTIMYSIREQMSHGNFGPNILNERRFIFPSTLFGLAGPVQDEQIDEIIGEILRDISDEIAFLIQRDTQCFWERISSHYSDVIPNFVKSEVPECLFIGAGEGSGTFGLLNIDDLGILLLSYGFEKSGELMSSRTKRFNGRSGTVQTSIHMTIYGVNARGMSSDESNYQNQPRVDVRVIDRTTGNLLNICRFTSRTFYPEFSSILDDPKLYPEWSLSGVSIPSGQNLEPEPEGYDPSTNKGTRLGLSPYGTALVLESGSSLNANSKVGFYNNAGIKVATWHPDKGDLILEPYSSDLIIEVELQPATMDLPSYDPTGTSVFSRLPKNRDNSGEQEKYDETAISVSIIDGPQVPRIFTPVAENWYPDDKFELKQSDRQVLLNIENNHEGFKMVAGLIHNGTISDTQISISLQGHHVGKLVNGSIPLTESKVTRDELYAFTLPRPDSIQGYNEATGPNDPTEELVTNTCLGREPEVTGARILEVAQFLPEYFLEELRYSHSKIEYIKSPDGSSDELTIQINSYVSPIWSRLDEQILQDYRTQPSHPNYSDNLVSNNNRLNNELKSRTLYINNPSNDAFIKYGGGASYTPIPSYNPVLSALRSFGLLEAIRDCILIVAEESAPEGLGLSPSEISNIASVLDTSIASISIEADQSIGRAGSPITNEIYEKLKWYSSEVDELQYNNIPSNTIP